MQAALGASAQVVDHPDVFIVVHPFVAITVDDERLDQWGESAFSTTTVPAMRSCQPRRRASMKIQTYPR